MLSLMLVILMILYFTASPQAQLFHPYIYPLPWYTPSFAFPTPIRFSPFQSYPPILGSPSILPTSVFPSPVTRRAAATITIFSTTNLIVYNPTLLLGPNSTPVTPSPILSLLAGQLLTFGETALSTANPSLYNTWSTHFYCPRVCPFISFRS